MLHKKFKPPKCKTALNLAKSRIKLLKNKKDVQVKQLRRELAQLLLCGQDQTARIRVELVVREEKMMAAFELIELYCELLIARLPILESQKDCPLDLKEAVASLIFAAPRCGDIPELQDVRKHLTAKYGKEFVAAATELRPNCGVSRNLVEKLSVKAPDGPTKVKILTGIAEENNLKWEPRWFEDENPAPSIEVPKEQCMEKAGKLQMEPLGFEISDNMQHPLADDMGGSKTSRGHPRANIASEVSPSTSGPDQKSEGYSNKKASRDSSGIVCNAVVESRQNWTMEFKDATTAAQAAAESAERASLAARAAAELSKQSNIVNKASSWPLGSSGHGWHQDKNVYAGSVLKDTNVEEHQENSSVKQRTARMQVGQEGAYQYIRVTKGTEATSFVEESTEPGLVDGSKREEYQESQNSVHATCKQVRQSEDSLPNASAREAAYDVFESPGHPKYANVPVNNAFHDPDSLKYQSSSFGDDYGIFSNLYDINKNYLDDSSYGASNYETTNDDSWGVETVYYSFTGDSAVDPVFKDQAEEGRISDSDDQKYRLNSGSDIFISMDHRTNEMDITEEIGAHTGSGAVFDASGSDDDEPIYDPAEKSYDPLSSSKSSPEHFTSHQDSRSSFSSHPQYKLDGSESFRISLAKLSEPLPLKFDSDGEGSESERGFQNEKLGHVFLNNNDGKHNTAHGDVSGEHEESRTIYSDARDLYSRQHYYQGVSCVEELHDLDAYDVVHAAKPEKPLLVSRLRVESSNTVSDMENGTHAGREDGMELDFRLLPSGRKNRRVWDPPFRGGASADVSSPQFEAGADGGLDSQVSTNDVESTQNFKRTCGSYTHFYSTGDDPEVAITPKSSKNTERTYSATISGTATRTWKDPTGVFYANDSDSEDDTPKKPAMSKNLLGAGLSRRTKGSSVKSVASSQPSTTKEHIPDSSSYATEVSSKLQTGTSEPGSSRHTDNSTLDEPAISGPSAQRKVSDKAYSSSSSAAEKRISPSDPQTSGASNSNEVSSKVWTGRSTWHTDNSRFDEPATSGPRPQWKFSDNAYSSSSAAEKRMSPSDTQASRTSNSNEMAPSRENSAKNLAHVHPKLPDFETLAARMQSLRTNHQ